MGSVSSPIRDLAAVAVAASSFELSTTFDLPDGKSLEFRCYGYAGGIHGWQGWATLAKPQGGNPTPRVHQAVSDPADAIRLVASAEPQAVVRPDSVTVKIHKGPMTASKVEPLVVQAWHEAFGLPIPALDELAQAKRQRQAAKRAADAESAALLATGKPGVRAFNKRPAADREAMELRRAGLAGCELDGVHFGGANLEEADLSGASLVKAQFGGRLTIGQIGRLSKAKLADANLSGAQLPACRANQADFRRANLTGADARGGSFPQANFHGANLDRADLTGADLRGADFTEANLSQAKLSRARFDDQTRWPNGFKIAADLEWKGTGADPRLAPTPREKARSRPTDFAGFLKRLEKVADPSKLDKTMKMLQADRFRLFARVQDDGLVGVVKSQSDPDLVYSCRLSADGNYACCTQNLNVCGGLRGSPCKHLLVLIVGLTQAGELDPATAHDWTQASRGRKPALDKDAMTETLLQYKGAEAGEIDWRPTETIPEDFY